MSKEEIKEDIINDINRLLSKDSGSLENVNEMFNNVSESQPQPQPHQCLEGADLGGVRLCHSRSLQCPHPMRNKRVAWN